MAAPESILLKIKLLLKLAASSNPNEAENAKSMADKLVGKYGVTPEELKSLEDKEPLYGEEDKLFGTMGLVGWMQQLALAVGTHFECQIVQEELVPLEGVHMFNYYVYGEPEDAGNVRFVFHTFIKRIAQLIEKKCVGRGAIYLSSYGEGVVEAIKENIAWDGLVLPNIKKPIAPSTEDKKPGDSELVKPKEEKEKPAEKSVDVNSQSMIKDVMAYFKGLDDGRNLSLKDVLELEADNEKCKELQSDQCSQDGNTKPPESGSGGDS